MRFDYIAFDADDTLWHNERLYAETQAAFRELLSAYHSPEWITEHLYRTEMRNLSHFGYGIKAFALSMIETAIELTEGRIAGSDIQKIIDSARRMLTAEIELLDGVAEVIAELDTRYPLMVITKGDLLDQQKKMQRSGLAGYFDHVEIVSDKTQEGYHLLLEQHDIQPARFVMVGNSLRSDIIPVLALGAHAVYIPFHLTWAHEQAEPPPASHPGFHKIDRIALLPALLELLEKSEK
jgi:putative hydrolase of the HAD superfamily